MKPTTALILTHKQDGFAKLPHIGWLLESNPGIEVHVVVGADSPLGKMDNWKNADKPLRDWWREHRREVAGDVVAVIEWDTLVSSPFPELPKGIDLAGAMKFLSPVDAERPRRGLRMDSPLWTKDNWCWWGDLPRLSLKPGERAVGLVSFGCYLMRRGVLDSVISTRWDKVYSRSIQNELRFPTVANASGHKVGEVELPFVRFGDVELTRERGIYHSVDSPFTGTFDDTEESSSPAG